MSGRLGIGFNGKTRAVYVPSNRTAKRTQKNTKSNGTFSSSAHFMAYSLGGSSWIILVYMLSDWGIILA